MIGRIVYRKVAPKRVSKILAVLYSTDKIFLENKSGETVWWYKMYYAPLTPWNNPWIKGENHEH